MSKGTPMMAQYQAVKALNPDSFLFFRLGDFYELFGDDAIEGSRLLNITLTARTSGEGRTVRVPMAGIPYHAASNYIQRLLRLGKKVAICEQMEDPKQAKGNVRRELVRIITPGTALEEGFLDNKSNNYVAALFAGKSGLGLAAADNATGDFFACEIKSAADLEAELARIRPAEALMPEGSSREQELLKDYGFVLSPAEPWTFEPEEAARLLKEQFGVATLEGYGFEPGSLGLSAAGALLAYLKRTQKSALTHVTGLRRHEPKAFLQMDASTRRHLELTENSEDGGRSGTLFEVLDRTKTLAGARLLKRWLGAPLVDIKEIQARHDAVGELAGLAELRQGLGSALGLTGDLERALARVGCQTANARDLLLVRQTLRQVPELKAQLAGCKAAILAAWKAADSQAGLCARLDKALVDDPPISTKEGGMIKTGFSAQLDEVIANSHGAREKVLAIQERERERSGNPKLKVQFNNIFGFYIEVTRAQADSVPKDYERKQTLVGAERFTTPELKVIEQAVLSAEERRHSMEAEIFETLRKEVAGHSAALLELAARLSELDVLAAFASTAEELGYVRPEMTLEPVLELEKGRHPVVEHILKTQSSGDFTPNDCRLEAAGQQIMLLTGPNMAGKSTYMRQTALLVLMAQAGSFVPAARAKVGLVDRLFTRIGASDKLSKGMSTFLVEMTETANILRNATRQSLVVLDEIGRGTSTYDGVSIAWAVAEFLHEAPHLGCRTLFATHYFELTELAQKFARVKNWQVAVKEWQGKIVFLHEVRPGHSEHSYGIAVAKLAGVPEPVLKKAREVLRELEGGRASALTAPQMDLFKAGNPAQAEWLKEIEALDLDRLTPLEALQKIMAWKRALKGESAGV